MCIWFYCFTYSAEFQNRFKHLSPIVLIHSTLYQTLTQMLQIERWKTNVPTILKLTFYFQAASGWHFPWHLQHQLIHMKKNGRRGQGRILSLANIKVYSCSSNSYVFRKQRRVSIYLVFNLLIYYLSICLVSILPLYYMSYITFCKQIILELSGFSLYG